MFRTLLSRHLLASGVVLAAMLGLLLWNAHHLMRDTLQQRFDDERRGIAPLLVAALGPLLAARDYASIDLLVRDSVATGQLLHLALTDARGRTIAESGPAPAVPADSVPVTLAGRTLGELRFVLDTQALAAAQQRLQRNSLAIGAAVLLTGLALLTLAMGWLGREFRNLVQATRRMAEGDTAARLASSRVQELDEVSRAFNQMAEAVQAQLEALRDQQLFMRGVLDTLSEGYLIVDQGNHIVDCNETFLQLHGMQRPQGGPFDATITGARLFLPDGAVLPEEQRATRAVLASGQAQRDRLLRIQRHDGGASWVSVNATPLRRGDAAAPHAAMATLTDVTRHIEAEQSLRTANESLEQRVRERTAELERARDEAERASQAKSEFLSRMSHELRTPLNAILGFAQLMALERERLQPADLARLNQIETAGWHLLGLINDVLDLSRIEAGAMTTSSEPVELRAVALEALQLVQAQAATRGIRLVLPPPGEVWLRADRKRLKQVLVNLLSNAVKYNRDGGEVELLVEPSGNGRRAFTVRDTGRGFEPAQIERLYQPFTRFVADGEAIEGTGIGLVITRRLVELMQGSLSLQSEPGRGSAFRIELPLAEPPSTVLSAALSADLSAAAVPAPPVAIAAASLRLLYVEDNPSNVELLRQVLRARPAWALDVATDGLEGLERLRSGRYDGAIVDIDLPGIDGIELCRRLRADAATAHLPLLALSANAMPADLKRAMAAGFGAYVTKPLDVAGLLQRLDALLAGPVPAEGSTP